MKFLLDTNVIIGLVKPKVSLVERLRRHSPQDFGIPAMVAHELFYGVYKSQRLEANLTQLDNLRFEFVPFEHDDARRAGELRAHLALAGTPIGPYDVLIAAQALTRGLTLITHNTREFQRVPGLTVEDWE